MEKWLLKRIKQTEAQKDNAEDVQLKISKGSKLTVYKECLEYIRSHREQ